MAILHSIIVPDMSEEFQSVQSEYFISLFRVPGVISGLEKLNSSVSPAVAAIDLPAAEGNWQIIPVPFVFLFSWQGLFYPAKKRLCNKTWNFLSFLHFSRIALFTFEKESWTMFFPICLSPNFCLTTYVIL